ncbi:MAG TPA: FkbM family methyltransferase [Terriglobales bacterium]|nr:FkbM family methyltransferase [Terriglobales bacterium]
MTPRCPRKAAFVLAATDQGTLIVNRFDYRMLDEQAGIGVGFNLLDNSAYDPQEVGVALAMLDLAKIFRGPGVVAVDCGANIGVHTVEWARAMTGWGAVTAFEAQERVYYALAGNLALNNCFNASARHAAVGAACGTLRVPVPDYQRPGSFGSLELRPRPDNEFIGQAIDYSPAATVEVPVVSLDSMPWPRLDFIKIDVEGMELEVLEGARQALARWRPMLIVEALKGDKARLQPWLEAQGYKVWAMGPNYVAVHATDPAAEQIRPGG